MAATPASETVSGLLAARALADPEAPFLLFDGDRRDLALGYGDTLAAAEAAVELLEQLGARPGTRIHLDLANCPEFVVLLFAAAILGAEVVPTNPSATADDLSYLLGHSGATLSVTEAARREVIAEACELAGLAPGPRVIERTEVPLGGSGRPLGARATAGPAADPRRELAILYTSGTTSRPKGVRVTDANYLHVGRVVSAHLELRSNDRWLVVLPLFHANAQYYCFMSALAAGASVALCERFSASGWGEQASRHGATVASLFAAPIRMILASPTQPGDAENALRDVIFAQRVDEDQARTFEERFGCGLLQLYGMTETIAPPLMNPLRGERRNSSAGQPTGAELTLRDEDGESVECGELWVRGIPGETLMAGYLDDDGATAATLEDGWLRTGDILRREPGGWYRFEDRAKDMIKSAGENIAAAEVERMIDRHPDVFESAVIGIPDPIRDELVGAFVVPRPGSTLAPQELIEWCRERLVKFKVPAEVTIVSELPRTSVGKVQKHRLRELSRAGETT